MAAGTDRMEATMKLHHAGHGRRPDLLTRDEAAKYLGVSKSWLARRRTGSERPTETRIGGRVYYRKADLDYFIDNVCAGPGAAPCKRSADPVGAVSLSADAQAVRDRIRAGHQADC